MPLIVRENSIYTVRYGDSLYSIAQRFQSSVEEIMRINHLYPPVTDPGLIFPGDVLVIPSLLKAGKVSYLVPYGDSISLIAFRFSTYIDLVSGMNKIENPHYIFPNQQLTVPVFIYQIQIGDTLAAISEKFGVPLSKIARANQGRPGFQEDLIWAGYHLILPLPTSRNVVVWTPLPGTKVGEGHRIEGQARAFEANVLFQLRDMNGVVVSAERFTTADEGAPSYGDFRSALSFDRQPSSSRGELWVYTRSAKDGRIQDLVKTTVLF